MSISHKPNLLSWAVLSVALFTSIILCIVWTNRQTAQAVRHAAAAMEARLNETAPVVYAIRDVQERGEISSNDVAERQIPKLRMPMDAISSAKLLVGRTAKYGLVAGQIVSQHDIASIQDGMYCVNRLPPGMRAVSFRVDYGDASSGLIEPDCIIDIYATTGERAKTKTTPILSHVKVLAVGSVLSKDEYERSRCPRGPITIAVAAQQADKLLHALAESKVYVRTVSTVRATPISLK